jgi:hypothetical protein
MKFFQLLVTFTVKNAPQKTLILTKLCTWEKLKVIHVMRLTAAIEYIQLFDIVKVLSHIIRDL